MESRGPNRSLQERLVDERVLSPGLVPAAKVLAEFPVAPLAVPPPPRFMGYRHGAPTIAEVLGTEGAAYSDFAGTQASVRQHQSMPY